MEKLIKIITETGIVPVVKLDRAEDAVPLAKALANGGLPLAEVTFRTAAAADAIKNITTQLPDMLVGAGTVLTTEQVDRAVEAGAKFIVSPGFDRDVVAYCIDNGIATTPGCVTPTEITAALNMGLKVIKFFPANIYGGLNAMKNLSAPFVGVKFLPTGGINTANVREYIDAPFIHAVGGSWVCPKDAVKAGDWDKITALCAEARKNAFGE
jgi:2-dehydro-3-deoxyphosphogluconate aldolase/(4S)-4-hydroxy-2-oxoglutarate aldolase